MVSTIYSVVIQNLYDDCIEVRGSFLNFADAFSFAKEIVSDWTEKEHCAICKFFVQDIDSFTVYDEYNVPIYIVSVEANDLFA